MANESTRICLASDSLDNIEKVSTEFASRAKATGVRFVGPGQMGTKVVKIKTPLTPTFYGGGQRYGTFEIQIYQRIMEIHTAREFVEQQIICNTRIRNVNIDVTVFQSTHKAHKPHMLSISPKAQ